MKVHSYSSLAIAAAVMAACGSSTSPGSTSPGGGASKTVSISCTNSNYNMAGSCAFGPNPDTVSVGDTVTFAFPSSSSHSVSFQASGAPADVPPATGGNFPRTFATAGTFPYVCTVHPYMTGTVVVK